MISRNTPGLITANNLPACPSIFDTVNLRPARGSKRRAVDRVSGHRARIFSVFRRDICARKTCLSYLSFCGRGNPSRVQEKCGVGLPIAMHLSDTEGPGCIVCSMNLYRSWGAASRNSQLSTNKLLARVIKKNVNKVMIFSTIESWKRGLGLFSQENFIWIPY